MYVLSLIFFMVLRCNGCFASLAQVTTLKHILIWLIFIFLTFFSEGQSPNSRTRTLHLKTCFFYNLHLGLAFPRMIRPLTFWPVACSFYNYISNNLPSGLIMLIVLNHKWFNYIAYTCAYMHWACRQPLDWLPIKQTSDSALSFFRRHDCETPSGCRRQIVRSQIPSDLRSHPEIDSHRIPNYEPIGERLQYLGNQTTETFWKHIGCVCKKVCAPTFKSDFNSNLNTYLKNAYFKQTTKGWKWLNGTFATEWLNGTFAKEAW